jgi:hypothetical protein
MYNIIINIEKYFIPDDYDDFKRVTKKYKLNF